MLTQGAHLLIASAWPSPRMPRGSATLSPALMEMFGDASFGVRHAAAETTGGGRGGGLDDGSGCRPQSKGVPEASDGGLLAVVYKHRPGGKSGSRQTAEGERGGSGAGRGGVGTRAHGMTGNNVCVCMERGED